MSTEPSAGFASLGEGFFLIKAGERTLPQPLSAQWNNVFNLSPIKILGISGDYKRKLRGFRNVFPKMLKMNSKLKPFETNWQLKVGFLKRTRLLQVIHSDKCGPRPGKWGLVLWANKRWGGQQTPVPHPGDLTVGYGTCFLNITGWNRKINEQI